MTHEFFTQLFNELVPLGLIFEHLFRRQEAADGIHLGLVDHGKDVLIMGIA